MKQKELRYLDAPSAQQVGVVLIFSALVFFSFSFIIKLMTNGAESHHDWYSWYEIVYHLVCLVAVATMLPYLRDCWYTVIIMKKDFLIWGSVAAGLIFAYNVLLQVLVLNTGWQIFYTYSGSSLPVLTCNLFLVNNYFIILNPIFGALLAVLVVPLTTCCIYYATVFVKGYNVRPWLGYVLVVAWTLFPRLATGLTPWWDLRSCLEQFEAQLPVHLILCWLYQKTDNIWAPIFTMGAVNLLSCLLIIGQFCIL